MALGMTGWRDRRGAWRVVGAAALGLLLAGCGGGSEGGDAGDGGGSAAATTTTASASASASADTSTTARRGGTVDRLREGPLAAGEHAVDLGAVSFRFTIGEGWSTRNSSADFAELYRAAEASEGAPVITFTTPGQRSAIDHSPEALLGRWREAGMTMSEPAATTLGGLAVQVFDASSTSEVPLFSVSGGTAVQVPGRTSTMWLGRSGSTTVLVMADAATADHAAFRAEAEAVLRTLRIEA